MSTDSLKVPFAWINPRPMTLYSNVYTFVGLCISTVGALVLIGTVVFSIHLARDEAKAYAGETAEEVKHHIADSEPRFDALKVRRNQMVLAGIGLLFGFPLAERVRRKVEVWRHRRLDEKIKWLSTNAIKKYGTEDEKTHLPTADDVERIANQILTRVFFAPLLQHTFHQIFLSSSASTSIAEGEVPKSVQEQIDLIKVVLPDARIQCVIICPSWQSPEVVPALQVAIWREGLNIIAYLQPIVAPSNSKASSTAR